MRCKGKNTLLTFQKGILISIKSTQLLFKDLMEKYDISYILTHRLNQDSLESLFSIVRSRGGLNGFLIFDNIIIIVLKKYILF